MEEKISLEQYLENELRFSSWILDELDAPAWSEHNKVHNWRNYVPDEIVKRWNELSRQDKLLMAWMCEEKANSEEWD